MNLKLPATILVTSTSIICAALSFAGTPGKAAEYHRDKLSLKAGIGYLGGQSNEIVYDGPNDRRLSYLKWKIDNAAIVKGEANYDVFPALSVNLQGWVSIGKPDSVMDDYDWLVNEQSGWSHWSHHDKTDLRNSNQWNGSVRVWLFQNEQNKFGGMAGYQRNLFSFLATGGCFVYDSGTNIGCSPATEIGIGYKQVFQTFFIGAVGQYTINALEFAGQLKFGPSVQSNDVDQHYLRSLTFKEKGNNAIYYGAVLMAGYRVTQLASVFIEGTYDRYTNTRADTRTLDYSTGARSLTISNAGLSNLNYTLSAGVKVRMA